MAGKKTYSLKELATIVGKNIILILILTVIGGIVLGVYGKHKQTTTYTATRNILIEHNYNRNSKNINGQVNADISLMPTYKGLVNSRTVANKAYGLLPYREKKGISSDDLRSSIDVETQPQSLVMTIKATTPNKREAISYANMTAIAAKEELPKLQHGMGKIKVLAKANMQNVSSTTHGSVKKYALVGAALGLICGMIISFIATTWRHII